MDQNSKTETVIFRRSYVGDLQEFLRTQAAEHVKCLSENFEVTVINRDCDYPEICDRYRPDLALFGTGVTPASCPRLQITRTYADAIVPKIGFVNADAWCEHDPPPSRKWNIGDWSALFSISSTALERTPNWRTDCLSGRYLWTPTCLKLPPAQTDPRSSHRVDGAAVPMAPSRLRPRGQALSIPRMPSPWLPGSVPPAGEMMHGEAYARAINASHVVPAYVHRGQEMMYKRLEIPACNACLIAERSAALDAARLRGHGEIACLRTRTMSSRSCHTCSTTAMNSSALPPRHDWLARDTP